MLLAALLAIGLLAGDAWQPGDNPVLHLLTALAIVLMGIACLASWRPRATVPASQALPADSLAQLMRDKEAAEAANAAKSRYLANVSHEIRSPLNAIYGYAQLVERQSGVDPREAARVIRRSAEHLTDLVEGLLDISLVENGVMRVAHDVVRLPAFFDQIVRMFGPLAAAKGLSFRFEPEGRLPEFVRTDQKRLRQVLINLVSNAIKFTEAGQVTLRVRCSGQVAAIEVCDTGPGIAPEHREGIFAPFDRGEPGENKAQGFGLGLPITRAIVQILGGELDLDSTVGRGSCFRVRLLLPHVAGHRESDEAAGRVTGYAGRRRSVLVVDDDVRQLAIMREVLEEIGFEVAVAPDGDTAIALCGGHAFDLALLDVQMPGRSGWDTAAHLRATCGKGLRIVMLSANVHERGGPEGHVGAPDHDQFLAKPVEIGELVDSIGRQLGLTWTRAATKGETAGDAAETAEKPLSEAARTHVRRLRELLKIGHVRGIEAEIRALEQAAPEAHVLIAILYDCLDRFDLSSLGRRLEGL
ncbi:ATP-binding protein [Novosphingobium sp. KCTC 2891]|nr:ATP-binding protein [Novosphingobium sp. KCTC 2891]